MKTAFVLVMLYIVSGFFYLKVIGVGGVLELALWPLTGLAKLWLDTQTEKKAKAAAKARDADWYYVRAMRMFCAALNNDPKRSDFFTKCLTRTVLEQEMDRLCTVIPRDNFFFNAGYVFGVTVKMDNECAPAIQGGSMFAERVVQAWLASQQ